MEFTSNLPVHAYSVASTSGRGRKNRQAEEAKWRTQFLAKPARYVSRLGLENAKAVIAGKEFTINQLTISIKTPQKSFGCVGCGKVHKGSLPNGVFDPENLAKVGFFILSDGRAVPISESCVAGCTKQDKETGKSYRVPGYVELAVRANPNIILNLEQMIADYGMDKSLLPIKKKS